MTNIYDIAIIGAGAAGLQLAMAFQRESAFDEQQILILDKDQKDQNDRTWCYWEKGDGHWDDLLHKSWALGDFFSDQKKINLELLPYRYKMLRALDFYKHAKSSIEQDDRITWHYEAVETVEEGAHYTIKTSGGEYLAKRVFDSRIPADFFEQKDKYTRLLQHFKGWTIRTKEPFFNPKRFTMMDYRLVWKETTSFTYVLPTNEYEALIEFTFFSEDLVEDEEYNAMLRKYIEEILGLKDFEIIEEEKGIIPMSDFPFQKYSKGKHVKIGTAGGWVKPSSGYSFKNCEKNTTKIVQNLKQNKPATKGLIKPRFRLYDALLLRVLHKENKIGPFLFSTMFQKNDVQSILAFLDDESSLWKDIQMLSRFPQWPFLNALFNHIIR